MNGEPPDAPGVVVHRDLGSVTPGDLRRVGGLLDQFSAPRRLLVQWVPHGYGYRSMNLAFCFWLWRRATVNLDTVELMVHEPYLAFTNGSWKHGAVALVHRVMTTILLNAARRVWVSIPTWESCCRPYTFGRRVAFTWLPVPSNIPVVDDTLSVSGIRSRYAPAGGLVVGHFGTYGRHIAELLIASLPRLLRTRSVQAVLLLGRGSETLCGELLGKHPELAGRVHASGPLAAIDLSLHISACDVMMQPYPDGVSSRRTSMMVGLSHGVPTVTTTGHLTESLWAGSRAVSLAPVGDADAIVALTQRLLTDATERSRMSCAARALYQERFDVRHTIAALREAAPQCV